MFLRFLTLQIHACVVFLALVLTGAPGGLIVCHGDDGRLTVKPGAFGFCAPSSTSQHEHDRERESHEPTAREAPCNDVNLTFAIGPGSGSGSRSRSHGGANRAAVCRTTCALWRLLPDTGQARRVVSRLPVSTSHLSHLRTIILLV